jgi:pathogenesis-related protein 1
MVYFFTHKEFCVKKSRLNKFCAQSRQVTKGHPLKTIVNILILFLLFCPCQNVFGGEISVMQGITAAHNKVRRTMNVPELVWSDELAKYAQQWADHLAREKKCRMQHRSTAMKTSQNYGENIYWASARQWSDGTLEVQQVTPENVVLSWASEKKNYSFAFNSCRSGEVCGHYTQIVWKQSKFVGCGRAVCEDKSQVWVCNYDPPGNLAGQKPY